MNAFTRYVWVTRVALSALYTHRLPNWTGEGEKTWSNEMMETCGRRSLVML